MIYVVYGWVITNKELIDAVFPKLCGGGNWKETINILCNWSFADKIDEKKMLEELNKENQTEEGDMFDESHMKNISILRFPIMSIPSKQVNKYIGTRLDEDVNMVAVGNIVYEIHDSVDVLPGILDDEKIRKFNIRLEKIKEKIDLPEFMTTKPRVIFVQNE